MSIADDELLADLEENDNGDIYMKKPASDFFPIAIPKPVEEKIKVASVASIEELMRLKNSQHLIKMNTQIDKYSQMLKKSGNIRGHMDSNLEYKLILEANDIAAIIND